MDEPRIKDFLQYLKNKTPTNDFTRRLDKMVEELKTIEVGFTDYIAARQKEFDWFRQGKEQGFEAGLQTGLRQGIEQGRDQGAYEKALETARVMYLDKVPVETISKYTNLPLDVIQNLL